MDNARFERRARLTGKVDFQFVFLQPVKSTDRYFTVLARTNMLGFPRLGLAISRKAARSAVVRNRVKRVIRESFRHHQHELDGLDIVVIGRANLADQDNTVYFKSLQYHWANLKKRCVKF